MPIPAILTKLFAGKAKEIATDVIGGLDNLFTSKEEKLQKEIELTEKINTHLLGMEQEATKQIESEDKAVTERWKSDMASDSWWSKNIRPIVLGSLFAFWFLIIIVDSSVKESFEVKDSYIEATKYLLDIVVIAYFGSRGAEKVIPQFKKR